MPNTDRPNGAMPVKNLDGSPYNGQYREYPVDAANATAVFVGDFIMGQADGNVAPATAGSLKIIGVCVGVAPDPTNLERRYLPASTAGTIYVADAPDLIFEIQEDSVVSTLAATHIGSNCDLIAGAGSTTTGQSAHEIDSSTVVTTAANLRLLRLIDREDNAVGINAKWEVLINEHAYKTTSGV